jgi:hypothetical protein
MWSVATISLLATCAVSGYAPFAPSTWARWDSGLYLDIAEHGYTLFRCKAPSGTPEQWCGNAGWFPAYPWLVGALHQVGLPLMATAVAVSWLFGLGTIVLLWSTFLRRRLSVAALGCLVYAAFAPGQVYLYAIFPLSMLVFFVVLHLWLVTRAQWAAAGITGAIAALTYPVGLAVIPASALWLALRRARLRRIATVTGLALLGPAILAVDQRIETGRFDAYALVQQKYRHTLQDPFGEVVDAAHQLGRGSPFAVDNAPAVQTLFVFAVLVCVLVMLAVRRTAVTRPATLIAFWAVAAWLIPHLTEHVSTYRGQAALAPLALLVYRLPRQLLLPIVAVAVWLTIPMAQLFFEGKLV